MLPVSDQKNNFILLLRLYAFAGFRRNFYQVSPSSKM